MFFVLDLKRVTGNCGQRMMKKLYWYEKAKRDNNDEGLARRKTDMIFAKKIIASSPSYL